MAKRILIVDDEDKIRDLINKYLVNEGFEVIEASDGYRALDLADSGKPDLIVLDWLLPGISGLEVCRQIRQKSSIPIIMLTARTEEIDKLLGLELGADDYITKPFSLRELTARIRVVLRRVEPGGEAKMNSIKINGLEINLDRHEVWSNGKNIALTPTEFKMLNVLVSNPGRVYSRLQLLDTVFGYAYEGYERSIDTHISNLRKKIEPDPANPRYILTVYGIGYRFGG
ncbi:MAG: response regulator transcription factor [Desulfotomaculaceae bacterium]|nr:response regulator transcription factor [Desulfotomaculaceae bacterium]MDD4768133.1 response regulator transcription factor [Desulfotomaculaceae bacterium]